MEGESGEQVKDELESVTSLGESFMQECLLIRLLSSVLLFHAPLYFSFTCFDSVQDPLRTAGVIFYRPDAFPVGQTPASRHRMVYVKFNRMRYKRTLDNIHG